MAHNGLPNQHAADDNEQNGCILVKLRRCAALCFHYKTFNVSDGSHVYLIDIALNFDLSVPSCPLWLKFLQLRRYYGDSGCS